MRLQTCIFALATAACTLGAWAKPAFNVSSSALALTSSPVASLSAPTATLVPAVHPDTDRRDYANLIPAHNYSLFYVGGTHTHHKNTTNVGILKVHKAAYPAIQLQDSVHVSSIQCTGAESIAVTFNDTTAFSTATKHWSQKFVMILFQAGCGNATDSSLRTYHLVQSMGAANNGTLTITVLASDIDLASAAGTEPVTVDFGTLQYNSTFEAPAVTSSIAPLITAPPNAIKRDFLLERAKLQHSITMDRRAGLPARDLKAELAKIQQRVAKAAALAEWQQPDSAKQELASIEARGFQHEVAKLERRDLAALTASVLACASCLEWTQTCHVLSCVTSVIANGYTTLSEEIYAEVSSEWSDLSSTILSYGSAASSAIVSYGSSISSSLSSEGEVYWTYLSNEATSVSNDAESFSSSVSSEGENLFSSFTSDASSLFSSLSNEGAYYYSSLSSEGSSLVQDASATLVSVSSEVSIAISSAGSAAVTMIESASQRVVSLLSAASVEAGSIEGFATTEFDEILTAAIADASDIVGAASSQFDDIVNSASSFAWSVESEATAAASSLYSSLTANFPKVTDSLSTNSANINFDTIAYGGAIDTPWGVQGYLLKSMDIQNISLTAYCVGCDVAANLIVSGSTTFVLGLEPEVLNGSISVSGQMGVALNLGLTADYQNTWSISETLLDYGLPGFSIPDVLVVGPSIEVSVGGSLSVDLDGAILAGLGLNWPAISANLDLIDSSQSGTSGFDNVQLNPLIELNASCTVNAEVYIAPRIQFGIDILPQVTNKLHYEVGIVEQAGILFNASASASFEYDNGTISTTVGDDSCAGVGIGFYYVNEVYLDVIDEVTVTFEHLTTPLFATCFTISTPTALAPPGRTTTVSTITPSSCAATSVVTSTVYVTSTKTRTHHSSSATTSKLPASSSQPA